ncbi:p21-activated protein kinase-interacting protein 1-like [Haemaphysalis longicornis]|uniref:P21-activated protein n=1 Tax=Haemaphysalis longicornis TaxID=44386 RepID=A0A9J6FSI0_HAELO|nr:hypothetical protein HPB48_010514 [Haemaphysalis longicornis]
MAAPDGVENVFDVILGTYEEFLLGYALQKDKDGKFTLEQFFTNHSHLGSIRCLASGGRFVASGSVDETVRLFNMRARTEMGTLMQQEGTITSLQFYKSSHLFSASEDKTICVWNTGSWQCLKTLRGHKAEVVSLAVHPTGKLLLSVSKDKTLRTWNLVKGRNAYITNIKAVADFVQWSPDGAYFVVGINNTLDVYSTEKAGKVHSIDFGKRVGAVTFVSDEVVLLAGDGGNVDVHNVKRKCVYHMFTAHANRVKAMHVTKVQDATFLVTAGSDGSIRVWEVDVEKLDENPKLLCEARCGCRITCMAIHSVHEDDSGPRKVRKKKKKSAAENVDASVGDEASQDGGEEEAEGDCQTVEAVQPSKVKFDEKEMFQPPGNEAKKKVGSVDTAKTDEGSNDEDIAVDDDDAKREDDDDESADVEQKQPAQGNAKARARKRKKKGMKHEAVPAAKEAKTATETKPLQKDPVARTPPTKDKRKRKRGGKLKE